MIENEPELANSHFFDARELQRLPVRIEKCKGGSSVFLADQRITLPIAADGITVERRGSWNVLTLSIFVGDVSMDSTPNKEG